MKVVVQHGDTAGTDGRVNCAISTPLGDQLCRWSRFKHLPPAEMYNAVAEKAFPFKSLGGDGTAYARHMKDAMFKVPNPGLARPRVCRHVRR